MKISVAEWKSLMGSSICMLSVNTVLLFILLGILIAESRREYDKSSKKLGSMTRSFCVFFCLCASMFALFDSFVHVCNILVAIQEKTQPTGRSSSVIQWLTGLAVFNNTVTNCCLICFVMLLLYSAFWKAYLVDIQVLPIALYERRITGVFGIKGFCVLMTMILCPLLITFDVTDASMITFNGRSVMSVKILSDVVLLLPMFIFLPLTVMLCAKVIYVTKEQQRFCNTVVYARTEVGETEFEVVLRAKRASIIYIILSCLMMLRQVCFLVGKIVVYLDKSKSKEKAKVIARSCVEALHWFFILSFVIMYFMPLNRTDRTALAQREAAKAQREREIEADLE